MTKKHVIEDITLAVYIVWKKHFREPVANDKEGNEKRRVPRSQHRAEAVLKEKKQDSEQPSTPKKDTARERKNGEGAASKEGDKKKKKKGKKITEAATESTEPELPPISESEQQAIRTKFLRFYKELSRDE
ncbi:hypothetical protein IQ06DRAFT_362867 [Phaeosphaeriaceae sp. SRC1lsM3a]|nr:hypothetical protein IQ06DRAFT_362867 [Stagonospora sp. SRC1lsM3a]